MWKMRRLLAVAMVLCSALSGCVSAELRDWLESGETGRGSSGRRGGSSNLLCLEKNLHRCNNKGEMCEEREVLCEEPEHHQDAPLACYVVWRNESAEHTVHIKGCWFPQESSSSDCASSRCVAKSYSGDVNGGPGRVYFCCCRGNLCNSEYFYEPDTEELAPTHPQESEPENESFKAILYAFIPICLVALLVLIGYWTYRRYRMREYLKHTQLRSVNANNGVLPTSDNTYQRPIQLIEVCARGRFGQVWRASLGENKPVAVKVFPAQDAESWMEEQEIYSIHGMREHPNILGFVGAEVRGTETSPEYWLITLYQERGSLTDFLKTNTLTLHEAYQVITGMLRGLSFLHEEQMTGGEEIRKPCIVHRDLKSKNVLLKDDLTPCVADFGLALKCEHGRTPDDTHAQVGTRRYMAPEILEGATEFSAFAFRQVDVYAAALIMWEVLSRSKITEGQAVPEYKLPFEEEVGLHPTLSQMQELVANQKKRPELPNSRTALPPETAVLCTTIQEMWDTEPEARITSGCAWERLNGSYSLLAGPPSPLPLGTGAAEALPPVGYRQQPQGTEAGREEATPLITNLLPESKV